MHFTQGFGGKFGVQNDRMDRSAVGFQENPDKIGTNYTKTKPDIGGAKPSNLRAKFENFAKVSEEESLRRAAEQKKLRVEKDRLDREAAAKKTVILLEERRFFDKCFWTTKKRFIFSRSKQTTQRQNRFNVAVQLRQDERAALAAQLVPSIRRNRRPRKRHQRNA